MISSGILIDIRTTLDNEKPSYTKYTSGILIDIQITLDKRNEVIQSILQVFS